MKELNRIRRLIVATVLFVIIIIIGLISLRKPDFEYKISAEAMVEEISNIDNEMLPDQAMEILANDDSSFVFVDLRNPYDYNRGFLGNAVNIPVSDILNPTIMEFFRQMDEDSIILVFYAKNQQEANGPWMLLKQIGIDNSKVLLGGYESLFDEEMDSYDLPEIPAYAVETPIIDFAAFIEEAGSSPKTESTQEQKIILPVQRKKKTASEGGC